jgi:hypothetical protein
VLVLEFDARGTVGDAAGAAGLYSLAVQTQFDDNGIGRNVENYAQELAGLLIDIEQSLVPSLNEPIIAGQTQVTGTTSEGAGTTIVVYVNGNEVATAVGHNRGFKHCQSYTPPHTRQWVIVLFIAGRITQKQTAERGRYRVLGNRLDFGRLA